MTAGEVMNRAAALLNDPGKSLYTFAVQIPHLNVAIDELQEEMELAGLPATRKSSAVYVVGAGAIALPTALPTDLVELQELFERPQGGISSDWFPMDKTFTLPDIPPTASLIYWTLDNNTVKFIGASGARDVRVNYIAKIQATIVVDTDLITILNSMSYLAYRTAGLIARFVGENPSRADALDTMAIPARDKIIGIGVKANQGMPVRRAPFMANYKAR